MAQFPAPTEGIAITHFIVSRDVERSRRFYVDVLGGEAALEGELSIVALANGWITISVGGGPTEDKPTVTLEPPRDPDRTSGFLNIRVADIGAVYRQWSARGAQFLTPPIDRAARSAATCAIPMATSSRWANWCGDPRAEVSADVPAARTRKISGRQTFPHQQAIKARFQRGLFKMTK
jgi:catechol 2,3-dioxygenase-like lactoylglutathione lyase family enzyme